MNDAAPQISRALDLEVERAARNRLRRANSPIDRHQCTHEGRHGLYGGHDIIARILHQITGNIDAHRRADCRHDDGKRADDRAPDGYRMPPTTSWSSRLTSLSWSASPCCWD